MLIRKMQMSIAVHLLIFLQFMTQSIWSSRVPFGI